MPQAALQCNTMRPTMSEPIKHCLKVTMCPKSLGSQEAHTRPPETRTHHKKNDSKDQKSRVLRRCQERQAQRATGSTYLFGGPFQDCARVFPVKGARDALRNLEAINWYRSFPCTCNPSNNGTKGRPHATHFLKVSWTEGDASLSTSSGGPLEEIFTGFDKREDARILWRISLKRGPGEKRCRRKSHASWPSVGPKDTDASRATGGPRKVRRVKVGGTVLVDGIAGH